MEIYPYMKLSLVIPAYNEEKRIKKTLLDYDQFLQSNYECYEIIVVCDGCYDQTPLIVKNYSKTNNKIKLLEFEHRLGKGGGIIEGFKHAEGEIIGFTDADGATNPFEYQKLINSVIKGVDVAIGSRRVKGARITVHQSSEREFVSKIFNILVKIIFSLEVNDTQCGCKVFKEEVVKKILPLLITSGL
jgi:glycosyltransferase involved in cell wall biosynthesis